MLSQIIKKYGLLCGALLLLHPACDNNKWAKGLLPAKATVKFNAVDTASESFNVFFNRFSTDSAFQISRIEFPLKLTIIGGEGESDTTKFLQKKDWSFAHAQPEKKIITKPAQTGKGMANIHFFIEDTGVSVYYKFVSRRGKWWMTSIRDESD
jgi:hypothetical protein